VTRLVLAQAPPGPAPDAVRRAVQDVLSDPAYDRVADGPTILDRVLRAIAEQLGRLLLRVDGDGGPGSVVAAVVLVAVVVALVVLAVAAIRRLRRGAPVEAPLDGPVGRPPADWAADAAAHERAGRLREAMRSRYRQAIAHLAAAGVVDEVPGRTTGEYRRAVERALPHGAAGFGAMTDAFDRAWYGGEPVDAAGLAAFCAHLDTVLAAVPRGRRPVGV
jgi:hypothetical protein